MASEVGTALPARSASAVGWVINPPSLSTRPSTNSGTRSPKRAGTGTGRLAVAACFTATLLAGCAPVVTRFEVLSFKGSDRQELYAETFPAGSFAVTAHQNYAIVFELHPEVNPIATGSTKSADTSQIVRVEMFWKPRPGTTYAESSQTNANISYCLISGRNAVTYEGAGFVYFTKSYNGTTITGQIESATLVPVHFLGEPADLFGPCHLRGGFTASEDRRKVVTAEQRLGKYKGPKGG